MVYVYIYAIIYTDIYIYLYIYVCIGVVNLLSWFERGVCDSGDMGTNPDHGYRI